MKVLFLAMQVVLAFNLAVAAGLQNSTFVGRYVGEEQTAQGRKVVSVALRSTNVAVVVTVFPDSTTPQRERGRWEIGSTRNQIRIIMQNGNEYEFFYRNGALTGGLVDNRAGRPVNRLTFTRVSDNAEGEFPTNLRDLSLTENGDGEFANSGQRPQRLTNVSVTVTSGGRAELTFANNANRSLRFIGWVTRFENNLIQISLVSRDNVDVNGTAEISLQSNRALDSIRLSGNQNNRTFDLNFRGSGRGGDTNQPDGRRLNLNESGTGYLQFGTSPREPLVRATVDVSGTENAEITLQRGSGNLTRLSGKVVRMGNGSMLVRLTNSGNANASGDVDVLYREPNTIFSIKFNGTVDGRKVTAEFARDENRGPFPNDTPSNLPIDWTQNGRGTYESGNQPRIELTRASVSIDRNEEATIDFRDQNGRSYRFYGKLVSRDAYSLKVNLTEFSGGLSSRPVTGTADISYGRNALQSINISGRISGERFSINFNR